MLRCFFLAAGSHGSINAGFCMSNTAARSVRLLVASLLLVKVSTLSAAVAPRTIDQLRQADLIVVGVIEKVTVESERSRVEQGFGNYDWGIYLTLNVEKVQKGDYSESEIEVRCFRIKSRRSAAEYLSVFGHDPVPGVGAKVRVYLDRIASDWEVVVPNGITPHDADTDEAVWSAGSLGEATEVVGLSGLMYTFLLPLEVWGLLFFVFLPIMYGAFRVVRHFRPSKGLDQDKRESSD
jgi:hypothetical protein